MLYFRKISRVPLLLLLLIFFSGIFARSSWATENPSTEYKSTLNSIGNLWPSSNTFVDNIQTGKLKTSQVKIFPPAKIVLRDTAFGGGLSLLFGAGVSLVWWGTADPDFGEIGSLWLIFLGSGIILGTGYGIWDAYTHDYNYAGNSQASPRYASSAASRELKTYPSDTDKLISAPKRPSALRLPLFRLSF